MTHTEYLLITADSDRKTYEDCMTCVRHVVARAPVDSRVTGGIWTLDEAVRFISAHNLKGYYETRLDDPAKGHDESTGCLLATLVQSALNDIDWTEMTEHYLTKIAEN